MQRGPSIPCWKVSSSSKHTGRFYTLWITIKILLCLRKITMIITSRVLTIGIKLWKIKEQGFSIFCTWFSVLSESLQFPRESIALITAPKPMSLSQLVNMLMFSKFVVPCLSQLWVFSHVKYWDNVYTYILRVAD